VCLLRGTREFSNLIYVDFSVRYAVTMLPARKICNEMGLLLMGYEWGEMELHTLSLHLLITSCPSHTLFIQPKKITAFGVSSVNTGITLHTVNRSRI